jgi:hypothetical protein
MPNSGERVLITVRASDPLTQLQPEDATGTAYLFAPPKNPSTTPADRTPDFTISLTFDETTRLYTGYWDSTGAAGGTWWCQGKISGGVGNYLNWAYQAFPMVA